MLTTTSQGIIDLVYIYYAYPMQNGQILIQTVLKLFVFLKTHVYQSTVFWKGKNYGLKTASLEH